MKKVLSILIVCLFCMQISFAKTGLEVSVDQVLKSGWEISNSKNEENYNENTIKYNENVNDCSNMIINSDLKQDFIKIYTNLDLYNKRLLDPVVDILVEKYERSIQQLFPGYGYADSDYNYKLGREIYYAEENLGVFWRNETRKTNSNELNETTVEKSMLANFTAKIVANGGKILGKAEASMNIDGSYKKVVHVKYTMERSITITCKVKYQKTKKWFELYRQKDGWIINGSWEQCGRTYKIIEEASGEEVALSTRTIMDQDFLPGFGYLDPDYNYKLGREISRESLGAFWRDEIRHIESNKVNETIVEKSLAAGFSAGITGNGGKILGKVNASMNINGSYKKVVKIKYTVKEALDITCKVKYQKSKAWFKLLRRYKVQVWNIDEWEYIGNFYKIFEEASGEEVAVNNKREVLEQEYFPGYGNADPDYEYQLGKMHNKKVINSFWADKSEVINSNTINETNVTKKGLAKFKAQLGKNGGKILKMLESVLNINGVNEKIYKVTYKTSKDITVVCKVKYNTVKVWYDLNRRKKATWPYNWHKWVGCGLTYKNIEEMTKISVIE